VAQTLLPENVTLEILIPDLPLFNMDLELSSIPESVAGKD
jgi:hypothetical protein